MLATHNLESLQSPSTTLTANDSVPPVGFARLLGYQVVADVADDDAIDRAIERQLSAVADSPPPWQS
jgi:hypothetical protein